MKRAWISLVLLAVAGCDKSDKVAAAPPPKDGDSCCAPAPAVQAVPRGFPRPDGVVLTGLPESPDLAACDAKGRWGIKSPAIDHSIIDPKEKAPLLPEENGVKTTLYRDSLPFPQTNWKSGDWEVTQLVYPVGKGYAVRYHVMNHGEGTCTGQLKVGARDGSGPKIAAAGQPAASALTFDLKIEPGISTFINVTTADLEGKVSEDALDKATADWEKLIGNRALRLPVASAATEYYANLAGMLLGVGGCAEAVAKTEQMVAKKDGDALRLLGGIPEAWHLEAIEAREIPTDFGPLSFKYQGVYNNRMYEFKPGCKPPGGFLIVVPEKLVARVDGKEIAPKDGWIRVPAGASIVEVSYPR